MGDATWKQAERAIARKLGGKRTSLSGALDGRGDVVTPWCVVEVKTRRRLPAWLLTALRQAERAALGSGPKLLPLVVLHQVGFRHRDDLVVLRLGDFLDWFGPLSASESEAAEAENEEWVTP